MNVNPANEKEVLNSIVISVVDTIFLEYFIINPPSTFILSIVYSIINISIP